MWSLESSSSNEKYALKTQHLLDSSKTPLDYLLTSLSHLYQQPLLKFPFHSLLYFFKKARYNRDEL